MSARIEGNRIIIPIEVVAEDKREWQEIAREARELHRTGEYEPRYEKIDFEQEEYEQDPAFFDAIKNAIIDDVDEAVNKATEGRTSFRTPEAPEGLTRVLGMVGQSPEASILQVLSLVAPQLGPILIAAGAAKVLFDWYFSPGAPGDLRFKRDMPRELNNLFTRMEKQQRRIGLQQVIITSTTGFRSLNGANAGNTFAQIRESGTANVGLVDKASGWRP